MKKYYCFLLLLLGFSIKIFAQGPTPTPTGKMPAPSNGIVYGKIIDTDGKALSDVTVTLMQSKTDPQTKKVKEVLVAVNITKANGNFRFESLPAFNKYTLKIAAVGFEDLDKKFAFIDLPPNNGGGKGAPNANTASAPPSGNGGAPNFKMPDLDKDLGDIALVVKTEELKSVVVISGKKGLTMDIDKKVFNVEKNLVSVGGTAADLMKNVPSVNVDIDGNVTLRNATPQIYIDGRPTTLTLDQIPSDAIESVEIITNPSAKYDASGGNAGILNLVLKKNKKNGYNGTVNAGVDKRGGLNGGAGFNLREDKFNISVNTFGNQSKNVNKGNTEIRNLVSSPNLLVDQDSKNKMNGGFLFGKFGIDYFLSNRLTLSLGAIKVHGDMSPNDFLKTDSIYDGGSRVSYSERTTTNSRIFNATGVTGGFKYLFKKDGEELTGDFNIFSGKNETNALYSTNIFDVYGGVQQGTTLQNLIGNGTNKFQTIQTDYVNPIGEKGKIEAGLRVQMKDMVNSQENYIFNNSTNIYDLVPSSSSNYKNKDNVYAAYATFSNSINNFGYKVGLRAESSDYKGELTDTKQTFSNNYPISLFPSVFLSQKLNDSEDIQLNYSRRVNRPFFMQVIPFIDSTDPLNWSRGNAGLKPEFINSLEASYSKKFKGNNSLLVSVYYKGSKDLITRYMDTITADGVKRPLSTYVNANSSRSVGAEFTAQNTFTKWWDSNTNLNIYNSKIDTDNITGSSQDAITSWFLKMNNNFKLPKNYKIQLSGTYQSKTNLPVNQGGGGMGGPQNSGSQSSSQGYVKSNYGVDLALQKSFLKNNAATLTLSVNDVFRTRSYSQYSESDFFVQNSYRINDAPMFKLNFSYKFGQMDASILKRKNMKGESEGMQGAMQGAQ